MLTGFIANVGLDQILALSLPAILVLCPVAIALILCALFYPGQQKYRNTYIAAITIALFFGSIDAASILDAVPAALDESFKQWLPLYSANASWLLPCVIVLALRKLYFHKSHSGQIGITQ